jgi:hypothetical protein
MAHEQDGERLVQLARDAIAHELGGPPVVRPEGPWFSAPAATFVTITRRGRLHGCIGSLAAHRPLAEDVEHNAIAAAFMDPRSSAFRAEWLPEMGVEVTLLSPLSPIEFTSQEDLLRQIVPRVDGLLLRYGPYRGTFLPQVWDSLPSPRRFLDELKVKAGLSPDFWAEGVEVSRFHVQKWGDRHAAPRGVASTEAAT